MLNIILRYLVASVLALLSSAALAQSAIKGKERWLTGSLSPMVRQKLKARGWQLHEQCEKQLFKKTP